MTQRNESAATLPNENQMFDFNQVKVQPITLQQLERTVKEKKSYCDEPLMGIYHFDLLHKVIDLCKEQNYDCEIYDLFAAQNRDKQVPGVSIVQQIEAQKGVRAVEAHVLRRVYANIRLRDFDTDEVTTNLAVSFHQRGIQVGFGRNVIICHNQCMLSPEHYAATYKDGTNNPQAFDIPQILDVVRSWLVDARRITVESDEMIAKMKRCEIEAQQMYMLIGLLTTMRVAHDTTIKAIRSPKDIPLNQAQITRVTEDMMVAYKERHRVTAWDLYNSATNLYKAGHTEVPNIIPANLAMVEFLNENVL